MLALGARAQTILQQESFETDGEGTRYVSNALLQGTATVGVNPPNQYFQRATAPSTTSPPNTIPTTIWPLNPVSGGALTGSYYWAGEAVRGSASRFDRLPGVVTLNPVAVAGYGSLKVTVAFLDARNSGGNWENNDTLKVQVRFNNAGAWTTIGQFVGDNPSPGSGGHLRQDTNLDGKSYDAADASSPYLTTTMTDYTFNVTGSGSTMQTRVVASEEGLSEEFAFDNIRVSGAMSNNAVPVLANIETTPLTYVEGAPATIVTNTLTISDADSPNLSSASVRITANFNNTEDVLSFTPGSGISGVYTVATGVLTLTGTASVAAYQAALRSVKYQNTDGVDASPLTRQITFSVTDNATPPATSASVARAVTVTARLNTAVALPYTEDFTSDGEGTRYLSNHYVATNGSAFTRTNNPSFNQTYSPITYATFTNISNGYYWFSSVVNNTTNPDSRRIGYFQTQQVNATNYSNLHFQIRLGASFGQWDAADYVKLYYRVGGEGGSWVVFGSFRGDVSGVNNNGQLRQDVNPTNPSSLPTGTALTPALANFDFALPAAVNNALVDFKLEVNSNESYEEFAYDLIQVTGSVNNPPTNITLSSSIVAENQPSGTVVGTLSSTDPDVPSQTFTYALVSGTGSTDNAVFSIVGDRLRTAAVFDFEAKSSYSIRVRTTDSGSPAASFDKVFAITLTNVNELTASISSQTNVSCNGAADGKATVTAAGEPSPYTYSWRNTTTNTPLDQTTATVTGLAPGSYSVTVAAANSFTVTTTLTITQPDPLATTGTQSNVTTPGGSDGTASVAVTGGTAPYTYSWRNTTTSTNLAQTTATVTGLTAGSYTVTVADASGCTTTRSYSITQPDCPAVVFTPATGTALPAATTGTAYSQTISTAPGGYTYSATGLPAGLAIDPGSGVIGGTPTAAATNAAIVVTATKGICTAIASYTLTVNLACPAVVFTPATGSALPAARVGVPYNQTISTTLTGYAYAATGLPDGLTIDPSSGIISGRPTAVATNAAVTIAATKGICTATANYTLTVTPASNLRVPENPTGTVAGLNYKYYEGFWNALPNFSTLTPLKNGTVATPDLSVALREDGFAFLFTGYVTVPTDGQYTFSTVSDDGSTLYIGSTLVVDNDGLHGGREAAGTIGLQAGTHAFTVAFFENDANQILQVSYAGPSLAKQLIPAAAYKRVANTTNQAPVANAGANQSVTLPANSVTLNGTASIDVDGTIVSYLWSQVSGPNPASFSSTSTPTPAVSGLVAGTYVFSLVVTDNLGLMSSPAQVSVTVNPSGTLRTPENPANTVAGLDYKYYEGFWEVLPSFSTLTPLKSGSTTALDLSARQRDYGYAFQYTGFVTVPTDGQYTFYTSSDDGSQLYIGSTLVVNNDGSHGTLEANGTIGLRAGTHAFTVTYFQNGGGQELTVSYQGPSLAKQVVPASALRRVAQSSNQLPVANAGLNQSIMLPINSTQLSGTGIDTDGTITGYTWSQLSGPTTAGFSSTTVSNPTVRGLAVGSYVFGLVVTDNLGANSLLSQVTVMVNANNNLRVPENPTGTVAGLDYKYYEGFWNALPSFDSLTPIKTGTVATPDVSVALRNYGYAVQYTGYVTVPTDGQYTFSTISDDGSRLYIGSTLVVDNDGLHGRQEQQNTIGLRAGTHAFTVTYFQNGGEQVFSVSYQGPSLSKQLIPASALRRVVPSTATAAAVLRQTVSSEKMAGTLLEVYPNPLTENGTLHFRTQQGGKTQIYLYNELGQLMTTLYNTEAVGKQEYYLPLADRNIPAGVYLVRLVSNGKVENRRITITR
ncbi:hypothetical protein GCM10011383_00740 [Hymenobacter cavernae]|uniref:T9SS C-terminal target domain-containing protein n=1 Tax=Hymenobacter cavernae TaxID=2044852 RepID=A0ABQ1TF80_9BACT|nr:hypothetical protein GCM10011383_00740 [Hymenobacter cavernae]